MSNRIIRVLVVAAAATAALSLAGIAQAGTTPVNTTSSSSNWSGYVVGGSGQAFSDVKGSWVEPTLTCPTRGSLYSSFWVGLGGASATSNGLEQTGSEADCQNGAAHHSLWYELIPAAPVTVPVTISQGDTISAEVSVAGTAVTLAITDLTTGATFTTTVTLTSNLDVSSAEWIAEAPSQCNGNGRFSRCTPLPLANFGNAAFSGASATANAHTGTISDTAWTSTSILLRGNSGSSATPGALDATGAAFGVTASAAAAASAPAPTPRGRGGWWRPHGHR